MKVFRTKTVVVVLAGSVAGFIFGGGPEPTAALDVGEFLGRLGLGTGTGEGTTKTNKAPDQLTCAKFFEKAKQKEIMEDPPPHPEFETELCVRFAELLYYKDPEKAVYKNGAENDNLDAPDDFFENRFKNTPDKEDRDTVLVGLNDAVTTCCENYGPHLLHTQITITGGQQVPCQDEVRKALEEHGQSPSTEHEVCQELAFFLGYKGSNKAQYNSDAASKTFTAPKPNPPPVWKATVTAGNHNMLTTCCTGYGPHVAAQSAAPGANPNTPAAGARVANAPGANPNTPVANKQQRPDTPVCCC
ncbi:unnamed protein product [Amoebophrya sp. A120]|nr:unnamed protein product [Amoebophrya sp. A120]|eukprot:GSA120T00008832001.1